MLSGAKMLRIGLRPQEETVTPKDLLAAADLLADSFRGNTLLQEDDKDSLENKRLLDFGLNDFL